MDNSIKISIVTPSYNSERTIKRALESILMQNYKNLEYIVIDGASTDNTIKILEEYKNRFDEKKIDYKYKSETDKGISDAFNKGIALTTGDYVGIVNSDDWLEIDAVRNVVDNIDNNHVVYFGDINLYEKGHLIKRRKSRYFLLWLGMYIMHPSVFVRRSLYEKYQFDTELKISMDYDLMLQIRKNNRNGFKYIPIVISNMELGGASADKVAMRKEELKVMKKHLCIFQFYIVLIIKHMEKLLFDKK